MNSHPEVYERDLMFFHQEVSLFEPELKEGVTWLLVNQMIPQQKLTLKARKHEKDLSVCSSFDLFHLQLFL